MLFRSGTLPWTEVRLPFQVREETNIVRLELQRRDSFRFDSKIAGTFWLDDVRITPAPSPASKQHGYQTGTATAHEVVSKAR